MPTPEVTPVPAPSPEPTPNPNPEPVTFTTAQQARIDELIRGAMGRAAAETRSQLATAQEKIRQMEAERTESETVRAEQRLQQERETLTNRVLLEAEREHFVSPSQVERLVRDSVKIENGKVVVLDDAGSPREGVTLQSFLQEFAGQNAHLVRSALPSGTGSGRDMRAPQPDVRLEQLFGKGSDAEAANRLALSNPAKYKSLRAEAQRRRLI